MLSVDEFRRLLKDSALQDEEVEHTREGVYMIARFLVRQYLASQETEVVKQETERG
jgi:hypothetical protein